MAITGIITASQGTSGTPVTFTDNTIYTPDSPADWTRQIALYDASATLLTTLTFSGAELTVTYAVTRDQYLTAGFTAQDGPESVTEDTINIGLERYYDNKFNSILQYGCCGIGAQNFTKLTKGIIYQYGASKALLYGQGTAFNSYITSAYAYLNS